jgi:molybdopterin converting factor small subunit
MSVHVKVLGALNKPFGQDDFDFQVAEGASLEDLLLKLGYHPSHLRFMLLAVNGQQETLGCRLRDGDQVLLTLPTSGG